MVPDHPLYAQRGATILPAGERKWRAVLIFAKGDMEFWANECSFPHWNNEELCGRCRCNRSDRSYKDFRDIAAWRATVHSDITFAARFAENDHPLVTLIKRTGMAMWGLDQLHIVDLNGISAHAIGNLLADVIRDSELPGCVYHQASFDFLNEHLADYYRRVEETDKIGEQPRRETMQCGTRPLTSPPRGLAPSHRSTSSPPHPASPAPRGVRSLYRFFLGSNPNSLGLIA